ncbi:sulfurtransferase [Shouchella lonarensis]|uniref:Thiosulfate/3-mercaptopyruvate sulfurtransferase n=1 Tax=Shouchella lonarensis TaxID=1464122 RepID=A0A1G6MYL9_9BACI|nr:sulfurtransferase [Shouchella lonarensis]SDC60688.1 thiosulfate/3-mercaptopyruvate sulfurtransferase [Shouchella lonarensis]
MFISAKELVRNERSFLILDVRHTLEDVDAGQKLYEDAHIPHAQFVNMATELADKTKKEGGRYPLPSVKKMTQLFQEKGVSHDMPVVVYDQSGGMMAARAWWMLYYLGHKQVMVLEGGFSRWCTLGYETTSEVSRAKKTIFVPRVRADMLLSASEVYARVNDPKTTLIDARAPERFRGEHETRDAKSGHIPGAKNYFWKGVLREDGSWKNEEELKQHFSVLPKDHDIVVYCASGISACTNVMALKRAGFKYVKLYAGSWSDWITHVGYPIETGN